MTDGYEPLIGSLIGTDSGARVTLLATLIVALVLAVLALWGDA